MYFYFGHFIPIEQVARSKWCTMLANLHEASTLLLEYKLSHIKHFKLIGAKIGSSLAAPRWTWPGGSSAEAGARGDFVEKVWPYLNTSSLEPSWLADWWSFGFPLTPLRHAQAGFTVCLLGRRGLRV